MPTDSAEYVHRHTPTLQVVDPRGLAVRGLQYHRRQAGGMIEGRISQQQFDAAGRPVASRDPYLFALARTDPAAPANLRQAFSLSGAALASDSVDAGWRLGLPGAGGQALEQWDGRGSHTFIHYDELLRPVAVHESADSNAARVTERFTYAPADADAAKHNLCGQLIRHDDPAGTLRVTELGLGGALLQQARHFLRDYAAVDWPVDESARDALLEPGNGAITTHRYAPGGELIEQTDALGNVQRMTYSIAGESKSTLLTLAGAGQVERTLVSQLQYNAHGQIESQTAGNGVVTGHRYDPADGLLIDLSAHKANGTPLHDLKYSYDAVGNVLSIKDAAQPIRYFNNQRIEPVRTYGYDTLYQLIEATGWEATTGRHGPALPDLQPLPLDPNQIARYTQAYHYDAGGNLLQLVHVGAQAHGRTLTRARYSNRCLPERDGRPPTEAELAAGFDANGNLRELQPGQPLDWDLRNQLSSVRPVIREDGEDDAEHYVYDGGGQRLRKIRSSQTGSRTLISEVRYLPGVEIRRHTNGELLHVINASAGSNPVQVLHWVTETPPGIANDQLRYSLTDHLGSSSLELDHHADLISQEWYYPFGATACHGARSAMEAKYRTVRYSGKERDATGLYYYGLRYYAPWLQRWINPDPAGYIDGMNLFSMVGNRPITFRDADGRVGTKLTTEELKKIGADLKKENAEGVLNHEDLKKTAIDYLKYKGAEPERYIERIMMLAGSPIPKPKELPNDKQKIGFQLFWSTNAGARYINGVTRNYYDKGTSQSKISLAEARKDAFKELTSNNGEHTVKLPSTTKNDSYYPAIELLEKYKNDPEHTINMMKASLGKQQSGVSYRGARLPRGVEIAEGDIVKTSGFTAFSPDEKTARKFTDTYHDDQYMSKTRPVLFVTDGGYGVGSVGGTEIERLFPPMTKFKVSGVYSSSGLTTIFLTRKDLGSQKTNHWI